MIELQRINEVKYFILNSAIAENSKNKKQMIIDMYFIVPCNKTLYYLNIDTASPRKFRNWSRFFYRKVLIWYLLKNLLSYPLLKFLNYSFHTIPLGFITHIRGIVFFVNKLFNEKFVKKKSKQIALLWLIHIEEVYEFMKQNLFNACFFLFDFFD